MHKVLPILFDPMEYDGGGSAVCNGHRCMMYKVLRYKVLFTLFDPWNTMPMEYEPEQQVHCIVTDGIS